MIVVDFEKYILYFSLKDIRTTRYSIHKPTNNESYLSLRETSIVYSDRPLYIRDTVSNQIVEKKNADDYELNDHDGTAFYKFLDGEYLDGEEQYYFTLQYHSKNHWEIDGPMENDFKLVYLP